MISLNPRHWFQKRTSDFAVGRAEESNRSHFNALYALDPDVLVRNLVSFESGSIAGFERILEEFELREDKMRTGSFKMSAAVASKPWEVRILKGEEENDRATLHRDVLTRFWNRIRVTDAFCRSRVGGFRLLVKQMMTAQSRVYAVHDIVWKDLPNGELEATFTFVPAWNFENRTGTLRFLPSPNAYDGVEMRPGEWMITVGEGVGIAAAILAMGKRLSWNDWLLFSEKCGMPVVIGNTAAKQDTPAWKSLLSAISAIAPKTGILADMESKLQAVQIGGASGQSTYRELVDTVDRAISALYRGGDLATVSSMQGQGTGSNAQDGESELMDGDGCAMIAETLNRQVERFVIRYTCGDLEPLAGIVLNPPPVDDDVDRNLKIDNHLGAFGVKLSKKDMLSRYGRVEAESDDDALELARQSERGALNAFANELKTNFNREREASEPQAKAVLKAFAQDMGPASEAVAKLLKNPTPETAAALLDRLPALLPDDPALATVIAEAMAEEFGVTLANSGTSEGAKKGWETRLRNGWTPKQLEDNKKAVRALAEKAISDRQSNETIDLGTVNGEAVSDIKRKTGIDVTGFKQTISSRDLRHADNRHGSNGETNKGQAPLTIEDYERIPELFSNYDRIEKGSPEKNTNLPSIRFIKKYDDGTLYGVDVIVEKDKTIRYKTGWKDAPQ